MTSQEPIQNYQEPRKRYGLELRIREKAAILIREKGSEANIDDLIELCKDFATEDEVFEAIVGTEYSTLYDACGY